MSSKALRTLGVAYKTVDQKISKENFEEDLILLGIVGMIDPPREEVKSSIEFAKQAGISTVMITGDHRNTALAIRSEEHTSELQSRGHLVCSLLLDRLKVQEVMQMKMTSMA